MAEVARIQWCSPAPMSVDEVLVLDDDGTAWLVIRTSRDRRPVVGTWTTTPSAEDVRALTGHQRAVDVTLVPPDDPVVAVAERVAAAARAEPLATLTFHAAALPDGTPALQAVGGGRFAAEVQLQPDSVVVHVERDDTQTSWQPMDPLITGFVSPDPIGLGGVGRPTEITPGGYGTIALSGPALPNPGAIAVEVSGVLTDRLRPPGRGPFRVRTAATARPV